MKKPTKDEIDNRSWHLSPMRIEQAGDVAETMREHNAPFKEIGETIMQHLHTNDDRNRGTTIYILSAIDMDGGVIVLSDHGNVGKTLVPEDWESTQVAIKAYGAPQHRIVKHLVNDEMLKRGQNDYTLKYAER